MQHLFAPPTGLALGRVKDTDDPQSRGRVKVKLVATDMDIWAACVVPSAGTASGVNYGVSLLPKNDEIVLVAFLSPDQAFVIGSVWSGQSSLPDEAAPVAQRYTIKTGAQTTMVLDDSAPFVQRHHPRQELDHAHGCRRHLHGSGRLDHDSRDDIGRDHHDQLRRSS